jgi:hypothetical protein
VKPSNRHFQRFTPREHRQATELTRLQKAEVAASILQRFVRGVERDELLSEAYLDADLNITKIVQHVHYRLVIRETRRSRVLAKLLDERRRQEVKRVEPRPPRVWSMDVEKVLSYLTWRAAGVMISLYVRRNTLRETAILMRTTTHRVKQLRDASRKRLEHHFPPTTTAATRRRGFSLAAADDREAAGIDAI